MPVEIDRGQYHVALQTPTRAQVPWQDLITKVLNAALMFLFGLGPRFTDKGGVAGAIHGEPIELRNRGDEIGLESDYRPKENPECKQVLDTYEALLRELFEEELHFAFAKYSPGAILEISDQGEAGKILWLAVAYRCSIQTADVVFQSLRIPPPFRSECPR
ncbi:MAG: hypothetical protein ABSC29_01975 [Minisyncoccia bacterium]|jgi:hypothetical protein